MKDYFYNVFISIDQLLNTLTGGAPDETLSARAWRLELYDHWFGKIARPVIDIILFFDKDHCFKSYLSEAKRSQLPEHYARYTTWHE